MPSDMNHRFFSVVPAGGTGSRLGSAIPKQYLPLAGKPLIHWAVAPLLACGWIEQVLVVVAAGDTRAADIFNGVAKVRVCDAGGDTRSATVRGGLARLAALADAQDDNWVLVHDAARPGLDRQSLERLRSTLQHDPVGGLLALPVADTVKRADAGNTVVATVARDDLWLAQTPQMFRFGLLRRALAEHPQHTDEAGAIEAAGLPVRLVPGDRANFKVTTTHDLELMTRLLAGDIG